MEINVHHCLIKNGKRYDKIAIDETVTEDKLPELWTKYRKKIGSIKKKTVEVVIFTHRISCSVGWN